MEDSECRLQEMQREKGVLMTITRRDGEATQGCKKEEDRRKDERNVTAQGLLTRSTRAI